MPSVMSVMKWLLGLFFVLAGIAHFVRPRIYTKIIPPYLPWPRALVYLSGACEIALGVLVLIPRFTVPAAWGLIALLIAVFPANLYMAMHAELFPKLSPVVLWLRLPLQGVLIVWAYWFTRGAGRRSAEDPQYDDDCREMGFSGFVTEKPISVSIVGALFALGHLVAGVAASTRTCGIALVDCLSRSTTTSAIAAAP